MNKILLKHNHAHWLYIDCGKSKLQLELSSSNKLDDLQSLKILLFMALCRNANLWIGIERQHTPTTDTLRTKGSGI
jgi:hypothetical protein